MIVPSTPKKGFRYYLKDCKQFPDADKESLWAEYKQRRREDRPDHVTRECHCAQRSNLNDRSVDENMEAHSTVLSSVSLAGVCHVKLCADLGANVSLIITSTLYTIEQAGSEFVTTPFGPHRTFSMASQNQTGTPATVTCKSTVARYTHLHV